ncbi:Putative FAD/NAD(P)-binding domain, FAD/NAD(P)-binding domain superfamily [Colletotrichum destructivum]|uniref:FAD/NAD(P)-binding domain, FAD/NAD(P)-binding domain superfamily n=1 Tax=Colletotrichum destructivum TaxID=34406 RepID=A0AAX4IC47_9PEZI|nr:Putative FAD/NAD(P)-binding domain, FAD/NAD(P)-binding domain superfamily [Colletotrichum destructivum]
MIQNVVILGAGYAGLGIAHKLLKYTQPKVKDLKVTLVSPSTHLYWNCAAVRAIIPGEFSDDTLFNQIKPGFEKYPQDAFDFVLGKATAFDAATNTVQVETNEGQKTIEYAHLIIATGSGLASGLPFKTIGTHEETLGALHGLQSEVKAANSIIISGAGTTGVETAGELGHAYGSTKQITLIVEGAAPLPGLLPQLGKIAAKNLQQLQVKLVTNARVTEADTTGALKSVKLSNGETLTADLYLPLFGVRPNTTFVPEHLLDDKGNVKLKHDLRVEGLINVWGVGDVGNLEAKQLMRAEGQALHLADNLDAVLTGNETKVKDLKLTLKPQVFVTIGKKKATGQFNTMKLPGFIVSAAKAKTFFTEKGPGLVAGKNIARASI